MEIGIRGRLRNFPLSVEKPLMPVFEAITNSIQSISEANNRKGKITVRIYRDSSATYLNEEVKGLPQIIGFTIEDDGIGFSDANFNSFRKADSTYKLKLGGKGVGRFTWLKVFEKAEIRSVFNVDGLLKQREFSFTLDDVIWDGEIRDIAGTVLRQTTVKLMNMHDKYQKNCPKNTETIVRRIIEHFLPHFSVTKIPTICLVDEYDGTEYDLNEEFNKNVKLQFERQKITIKGLRFTLGHFRLRTVAGDNQHTIHFCAHNRSAETHGLKKHNALFHRAFHDDGGTFVYSCCVSSDFFNERTNQIRTQLDLVDSDDGLLATTEPTRDDILAKICEKAEKHLEQVLSPIKAKNAEHVKNYIKKHPRYRPILGSRPDWIKKLHGDLSEEELNIELFKLLQKLEAEVLQEGRSLQRSRIEKKTTESIEDEKLKFNKYLEETNEIGFSKLAEYIIHRRAVINFIRECMGIAEDGVYQYEEVIHNVIFPMKKTSETIHSADQSNLWMLDDRLSYHYHLASDVESSRLGKIEVDESSKGDRMDIVVLQPFDRPHAFVGTSEQPFQSVTIVEFKRPMRNDYSPSDEKKDPIQQVWGYANSIKSGNAKDKNGVLIRVSEGTQFYAYVVCDITDKIKELALYHQLRVMPDGLGYYGWHPNFEVYTEIIDYQKLIQDAEKRNRVFFDKFGLPTS